MTDYGPSIGESVGGDVVMIRREQDPNTCPSCGHPWELHGEPELPPICSYQRSSPDATDGCRCARPRPAVVLGEPT